MLEGMLNTVLFGTLVTTVLMLGFAIFADLDCAQSSFWKTHQLLINEGPILDFRFQATESPTSWTGHYACSRAAFHRQYRIELKKLSALE